MPRNIEADGRNMAVRTYPELKDAVGTYSRKLAWRKRRAGEEIPAGELKGHSYVVGRFLCWLMTLSEPDRAHILEEGGRLLDQLHDLPADYDGPLPFEPRTESVFRSTPVDSVHFARQDLARSAEHPEDKPRRGRRPDGGQKSKRTG